MTPEHVNSGVFFFSGSRMNRRVRFGFALTEEEKRAVTWSAEAEGGLSEAAILRRLIRRDAKEQGLGIRVTADGRGQMDGTRVHNATFRR